MVERISGDGGVRFGVRQPQLPLLCVTTPHEHTKAVAAATALQTSYLLNPRRVPIDPALMQDQLRRAAGEVGHEGHLRVHLFHKEIAL